MDAACHVVEVNELLLVEVARALPEHGRERDVILALSSLSSELRGSSSRSLLQPACCGREIIQRRVGRVDRHAHSLTLPRGPGDEARPPGRRVRTKSGQILYPLFQFRGARPFPELPGLLELFGDAALDGWTVASWFVTSQDLLDDESPARWLKAGKDPALAIEAAERVAGRLAH